MIIIVIIIIIEERLKRREVTFTDEVLAVADVSLLKFPNDVTLRYAA